MKTGEMTCEPRGEGLRRLRDADTMAKYIQAGNSNLAHCWIR